MFSHTIFLALVVAMSNAGRVPVSSLYPQMSGRKIGGGFHSPYQSGSSQNDLAPAYKEKTETPTKPELPVVLNEVEVNEGNLIEKVEEEYELTDPSQGMTAESYTVAFTHMFEIIQDVLNIMRQMSSAQPQEKNGEAVPLDTWPMLKRVFRRYLALISETELLSELRDIIPVEKLDEALERDDSELLTSAIIQSFNPSMVVYAFNTLKALIMPLIGLADSLTEQLDVAQLREYIPETPSIMEITYPIRYLVHRGLDIFYYYFNNNEMRSLLEYINPFSGRSMNDGYYLEDEVSGNSLDGENSSSTSPYIMAAGIGSTMIASIFAYNYVMAPNEDAEIHNRIRRDVMEDSLSALAESNLNIPKLVEFLEQEDPYGAETKKERKNSVPKKYKDPKSNKKNKLVS